MEAIRDARARLQKMRNPRGAACAAAPRLPFKPSRALGHAGPQEAAPLKPWVNNFSS